MRRATTKADDDFDDIGAYPPDTEDDDEYLLPRRRRAGGWVVALCMLLAVGLLGWAMTKRYVATRSESRANTANASETDPRVESLLADGEQALVDGSLDRAQGDFDKASALAEHDPRALVGEARVAASKADVPWLKLRLLPADASEELRSTRAQLDEQAARARRRADDALAAAPNDPRALRAKLDALRLDGQADAARDYVSRLASVASQPETAYALAALDLARTGEARAGGDTGGETGGTSVAAIDRLRQAAAAEGNTGRARAALVYALAKSGDIAGAKTELARLDALPRPHALLPDLHAFVLRSGGVGRSAAQGAASALKNGDLERAARIYQAMLTSDPTDSEALTGLGDVARLRGDSGGAIAAYRRATAANPSYLPARLGLADVEWAHGDRESAVRDYAGIEDRFPSGTYPAYVMQRAEGSGASP